MEFNRYDNRNSAAVYTSREQHEKKIVNKLGISQPSSYCAAENANNLLNYHISNANQFGETVSASASEQNRRS